MCVNAGRKSPTRMHAVPDEQMPPSKRWRMSSFADGERYPGQIHWSATCSTDFAILFLPFEGIYAEVIRRSALVKTSWDEYPKITIASPTTLVALLNSSQMGFRTLAFKTEQEVPGRSQRGGQRGNPGKIRRPARKVAEEHPPGRWYGGWTAGQTSRPLQTQERGGLDRPPRHSSFCRDEQWVWLMMSWEVVEGLMAGDGLGLDAFGSFLFLQHQSR